MLKPLHDKPPERDSTAEPGATAVGDHGDADKRVRRMAQLLALGAYRAALRAAKRDPTE